MALLSVQFINVDFFRWARPHPAYRGGICGEAYFMYAAAGNPLRPAAQWKKDHLWMDTP
jgi:hypothetical protein